MLGVTRATLESEGGSMSGEEDFFSVARTMPLVAARESQTGAGEEVGEREGSTFDAKGRYALIDGVQSILCVVSQRDSPAFGSSPPYLFGRVSRYSEVSYWREDPDRLAYLGENVVSEKEYRSAILRDSSSQEWSRAKLGEET